jgi:RimJ/RimL family protein N-acetyltransferase
MTCKNCSLVPFEQLHIRKTFEWVSDAEMRRLFLMRGEVTWDGHLKYFSKALSDATQFIYAILDENSQHVGNCGFKNIKPHEGELWIYLGESSTRGKGIGTSATRLLVNEGFTRHDFRLIYLHVADFNAAAISMYINLGFVEVPLQGDASDWAGRDCRIIRMELEKQ